LNEDFYKIVKVAFMETQGLISEYDPLAPLPNTYYLLQDAMEDSNSDFAQIEKIQHCPLAPLESL
jgi:hypothetical protein